MDAVDLQAKLSAFQSLFASPESEASFKVFADLVPFIIWMIDDKGFCTYANKAWTDFTGRSDADEMGYGWMEAIHPEDLTSSSEAYIHACRSGEIFRVEFRMRRADGEYRSMVDVGYPRFDEAGNLLGYIGTCQDVTEMRKAIAKSQEAQERFQILQQATQDAIWDWNLVTDEVRWNDAMLEMFQYEPGQVRLDSHWWAEHIHPEDRERILQSIHQAIDSGEKRWTDTYRYICGDGSSKFVYDRGFIIYDGSGRPVRMIGSMQNITEYKIAENALKESEAHFRIMANASPNFVWTFGPDQSVTYMNEHGLKFLGIMLEKLIQDSWAPYVHPDEVAEAKSLLEEAYRTRTTYRHEHRIKRADGEYRWVISSADPAILPNGELYGYIGSSIDITERKETEEALKESEARFRNLADTAPIYMAMADETGNAIYFNKPWLKYTGREMDEMRGLGWLCTLHPEDSPKFERDFRHAFQNQIPINEQFRFQRADGEYRWMLAIGAPRFTEEGRFVGYFGTYTDFHELKEAQDAIRASEERFRLLADATPHFIWELNPEGVPLFVNKAALDFVGKTFEEYVAEPWSVYLHPDEAERITNTIMEAVSIRAGYKLEHRIRGANGEYRWFISSADPSFYPDGELYRYIGSAIDIHDRKLAEEALNRQHALVEDYARRLESSNKDLSQFASIVSHDLQAPLRKVFMFADFLKEKEAANLSDEGRDYLERMQRSTSRMQELITDLLALSRIDRSGSAFSRVDLKDAMVTVMDDLAVDIHQTDTRIEIGNMVTVEADKHQIAQMLSNLVGNAIKYRRPDATPHIKVDSEYMDDQKVKITVSDNGIGIKPAYFNRIFEIFQRLHNDTQYSGTGIGLAIVKRIADRHKGRVEVESIVGQGSTFSIVLPVRQSFH